MGAWPARRTWLKSPGYRSVFQASLVSPFKSDISLSSPAGPHGQSAENTEGLFLPPGSGTMHCSSLINLKMEQRMLSIQSRIRPREQEVPAGSGDGWFPWDSQCGFGRRRGWDGSSWLGWFFEQALPAWNASPGRTADSEPDSSSQHPLLKGAVREGS